MRNSNKRDFRPFWKRMWLGWKWGVKVFRGGWEVANFWAHCTCSKYAFKKQFCWSNSSKYLHQPLLKYCSDLITEIYSLWKFGESSAEVKFTIGPQSWLIRFPTWTNNIFLKFVEMTDHWLSGLWSVTNCMCLTFCMCKLLIKINIVQTQLWKNPSISFFLVLENNTFSLDCL